VRTEFLPFSLSLSTCPTWPWDLQGDEASPKIKIMHKESDCGGDLVNSIAFNQQIKQNKFSYGVYNQHESFIYLNLIVKNRKVSIERYFK
jgi:hypothetical protein